MNFIDKLKTTESKKYLRNWLGFGVLLGLLGVTTPYTGKEGLDFSYLPLSLIESLIFVIFCFIVFVYLKERNKQVDEKSEGTRGNFVTALLSIFIVKVAALLLAFSVGLFN